MTENEKLIKAAGKGDMKAVKAAIKAGADDFKTAARFADAGVHTEIVELMIKNGVDAHNWMLAWSAGKDKIFLGLVEKMIDEGADDYNWGLSAASKGGRIEMAEFMIENGADNYDECIAIAAKNKFSEVAGLIQDYRNKKRKVHVPSPDEKLLRASKYGDTKTAAEAVKAGAKAMNRALMRAARGGHFETIKLLVANGADDLNEPMAIAVRNGCKEIADMLIKNGAGHAYEGMQGYDSVLSDAAYYGYMDIVKLMIDKGEDDFKGGLISAAEGGHVEIANLMLKLGAGNYKEAIKAARVNKHSEVIKLIKKYRIC